MMGGRGLFLHFYSLGQLTIPSPSLQVSLSIPLLCVIKGGVEREGGRGPQFISKATYTAQPTDAEFVFSVLVRESKASAVGDDDKIYYFFMEREEGSSSFTQSRSNHRVARVARVCKVDRAEIGHGVEASDAGP